MYTIYVQNDLSIPGCYVYVFYIRRRDPFDTVFSVYTEAMRLSMFNSLVPTVYVPVNWVSIGSGNGLWHVHLQPITRTNDDYCQLYTYEWNWIYFESKYRYFHSQKGSSILAKQQCITVGEITCRCDEAGVSKNMFTSTLYQLLHVIRNPS